MLLINLDGTCAISFTEEGNDNLAIFDLCFIGVNSLINMCLQETSPGRSKMRMPTNLKDSLSWRKERNQNISNADAGLIATAISSVNKFSNDGNFMREFMHEKSGDSSHAPDSSNPKSGVLESKPDLPVYERTSEDATNIKPALSANQLAAKVMQLRMKGMHDEAEKLLVSNKFTLFCRLFKTT